MPCVSAEDIFAQAGSLETEGFVLLAEVSLVEQRGKPNDLGSS